MPQYSIKDILADNATVLDPTKGPGEILVTQHAALTERFIKELGRWTGFHFKLKLTGDPSSGELSLNGADLSTMPDGTIITLGIRDELNTRMADLFTSTPVDTQLILMTDDGYRFTFKIQSSIIAGGGEVKFTVNPDSNPVYTAIDQSDVVISILPSFQAVASGLASVLGVSNSMGSTNIMMPQTTMIDIDGTDGRFGAFNDFLNGDSISGVSDKAPSGGAATPSLPGVVLGVSTGDDGLADGGVIDSWRDANYGSMIQAWKDGRVVVYSKINGQVLQLKSADDGGTMRWTLPEYVNRNDLGSQGSALWVDKSGYVKQSRFRDAWEVSQVGHGFAIPANDFCIPVKITEDGNFTYSAATADIPANLHNAYIVEVIDADNFVVMRSGIIDAVGISPTLKGTVYLGNAGGLQNGSGTEEAICGYVCSQDLLHLHDPSR